MTSRQTEKRLIPRTTLPPCLCMSRQMAEVSQSITKANLQTVMSITPYGSLLTSVTISTYIVLTFVVMVLIKRA